MQTKPVWSQTNGNLLDEDVWELDSFIQAVMVKLEVNFNFSIVGS